MYSKLKDNKLFLFLYSIILLIIPLGVERFVYNTLPFNFKRFLFITFIVELFGLIFIKGKKGIDFMYEKRFYLGLLIFIVCVTFKVNYSSSGVLDTWVQPSYLTVENDTIIGKNRSIRSDEYVVSTPTILSQYYNNYSFINKDIMANDTVTSLYPKLPSRNIFTLLTTPQFIGFLFLPVEYAFSFYQLLPWFIAFFSLFEMFMVLTKKNKLLSLASTLFALFSPITIWFDSEEYLLYVSLLFNLFHVFTNNCKTKKSKFLVSVLFGIVLSCFVMNIYPAWQVAYGYVLGVLCLALLLTERKKLKCSDLLYLIPVIIVTLVLVLPNIFMSLEQYKLTTNTVYPGKRFVVGGDGLQRAFYYVASIFFSVVNVNNPCEASGFIALFPIPLIVSIYVLILNYKNKYKDYYLLLLTILGLLYTYIILVGNGFITKFTLLYLTPIERLQPVLDFICLLIIIRLVSNYKDRLKANKVIILLVSILLSSLLVYVGTLQINEYFNGMYMTKEMIIISFIIYLIYIYGFLSFNSRILNIIMIIYAIFNLLTVFPLNMGLDVFTDKPLAKEILKLSKADEEAKWLAFNNIYANYALANDARIINSTNYYPNFNNWNLLDTNGKYKDIYNRYAHISVNLTDEETSFSLIQTDAFLINLNYNDMCKLKPTYYLTCIDYDNSLLEKIYEEDGVYIYRVKCT